MSHISENILEGTPQDVVDRYKTLPQMAAESDFGELDSNVVVLDTETTGLSFTKDELIQIAAARLEGGEITDWYVTFVDPGQLLPDDIVQLTHIQESDLVGAPDPHEALTALVDFVGDATIVAHNAEFDKTFTTKHPEGSPLKQNRWVDTLELSHIALPRLKSHRLIDLVRMFGAPTSTHRADDDVAATCVIYRVLLAAVKAMPQDLLTFIATMTTPDKWPSNYVFRVLSGAETKPSSSRASFSLHAMRKKRCGLLSSQEARTDADKLAGKLNYPNQEELTQAFSKDGFLGRIYEDHELRSEQLEMACGIARAFGSGENFVVEAGTGVGKSMAYLVPSVLMARANSISVGVATKTNNLLDQLVYKDLPDLSKALGKEGIQWASLKGMVHYPCLRKINRLVDAGPSIKELFGKELSQAPHLAALLSFVEQTDYGDLDGLKIDYRVLPKRSFVCTSQECLRHKCPFFGKLCYAHGARRRAESADIIVTNHALLFCNVAADGELMPPIRHWIIDEAHATEDEARSALAQTIDSEELLYLAGRVSKSSGARNIFKRAEQTLSPGDTEALTTFFALNQKARTAGEVFADAAGKYYRAIKDLLYFDPAKSPGGRRGASTYDHVDIWINSDVRKSEHFLDIVSVVEILIEQSDKLLKALQSLVAYLDDIDEAAAAQRDLASLAYRVKDIRNTAELVFKTAADNYVFQASIHRKKDRFNDTVGALLLNIGEKLNEEFYTQTQSVIYTSATLSINESFNVFEKAVGLNGSEFSVASSLLLKSSFDFDKNMVVYVVDDMPEPNDEDYADALNDLLFKSHCALNGSVLTLFTNRKEMEAAYNELCLPLREKGLQLVCQKYGISPKTLRDNFLQDEHLSLFALKSFWQGFDAPGATLKGVVVPRLPFTRPTDPLYCERRAREDDAWWKYVLPKAVIETKQAAGRLIRKASDKGVFILADRRVLTKGYRNTFLGSLQSKTIRVAPQDEIVAELAMFEGNK